MKYNDLVSVIVIAYNSSSYVIDTLESIKNQTYNNIELVISDDCSTDDTITKVTKWIDANSQRFTNVKVVIALQNNGISGNCNQGLENAQGKFLQYIAADDLLLPNCIQDKVNFVINNPDISILFSDMEIQSDEKCSNNSNKVYWWESVKDSAQIFFDLDAKSQFEALIRENLIPASTNFIKKEILEKVGGFDERFPMLEDWPLWTKITSNGIKLHYFNKKTVIYRIHNASISNEESMINPKYFDSLYAYFIKFRAKHLSWSDYWDTFFCYSAIRLCIVFGNKRSLGVIFKMFIYYPLIPFIHPSKAFRHVKKLVVDHFVL